MLRHSSFIGIHDLDEVHLESDTLTEELASLYGVDVGLVDLDVGVPKNSTVRVTIPVSYIYALILMAE